MDIDGNNNLPKSCDELYACLMNGDSIYFKIKKKQAGAFKRQALRINQSEFYLRNRNGLYSRVKSFLYMVYVGIIEFLLIVKYRELETPLVVYAISWPYIANVGGKDLPNKMGKIIFYGRLNGPTIKQKR